MRLYELIDFLPRATTKTFKDRSERIKKVPNTYPAGKGHFGTAYDHDSPKRSGEIIKYAKAG